MSEPLDIAAELKKVDECCWAADPKVLRQALDELQAARKTIANNITHSKAATASSEAIEARLRERITELEAAMQPLDKLLKDCRKELTDKQTRIAELEGDISIGH